MHRALEGIRKATLGTPFEGSLWLVGGAVRDELLGRPEPNDWDIVTELSSGELAKLLFEKGLSAVPPVTYARFGTALVRVYGADIELATARRESYAPESRKPEVEPASLQEDAYRRDFTVNALLRNLHSGELADPLGKGLSDLRAKVLRTPLDPKDTFRDDPLRMLRAVRFVWTLGFRPAEGLYEAIRAERERLGIISAERIRDELVKLLRLAEADRALEDLRATGLLGVFAPELEAMKGVTQGSFHHLDVWDHTLLVLRNAGADDISVSLAALLHDVGKPQTRSVDQNGEIRFFQHERVGEKLAREVLGRLRFSSEEIERVAKLVRNHMRLMTAAELTPAAVRRLARDLGPELGRLLDLVEADLTGLRPGVMAMDMAAIRSRIHEVLEATPAEKLASPLGGQEIMALTGTGPGPAIGRIKTWLLEAVLEGRIKPEDRRAAMREVFAADGLWRGAGKHPPSLASAIQASVEALPLEEKPALIAISGFAGAGKTRFASELASALPKSAVVSVDEFWLLDWDRRGPDWPGFDRQRFAKEVLEPSFEGKRVAFRPFDWGTGRFGESVELPALDFLIAEGVGLFHPDIAERFDLRIWLDAPMGPAHENAMRRDVEEYGVEHGAVWREIWIPNDRDFDRNYRPRERADLVLPWFKSA
jgi:poly(A) polymerase